MASSGRAEALDSDDDEIDRPPGYFTLHQGFPRWIKQSTKVDDASTIFGSVPAKSILGKDVHDHISDEGSQVNTPDTMPIVDVVRYMRSCFEDESIMDSIPLEHCLNPSAWYAWKSHRAGSANATDPSLGTQDGPRDPSEWNWDGVFASRAERVVQGSLSKATLYGNGDDWDETIRFLQVEGEEPLVRQEKS